MRVVSLSTTEITEITRFKKKEKKKKHTHTQKKFFRVGYLKCTIGWKKDCYTNN